MRFIWQAAALQRRSSPTSSTSTRALAGLPSYQPERCEGLGDPELLHFKT